MVGVFQFDMQIVAEIGYDIEMHGVRNAALRVMVMSVMIMIAAPVMLFFLDMKGLQSTVRHPRPESGQYENQDQECG